MATKDHINTHNGASQLDVGVNTALYFRMCFIIRLHGCRLPLVGKYNNQVNLWFQQFNIWPNRFNGVTNINTTNM